MIRDIPGIGRLELKHLLLDLNGTVTAWSKVDPELPKRLERITGMLDAYLLSADTYGTLDRVAGELGLSPSVVADGDAKLARVVELGTAHCIAIGNGANDAKMLKAARIGIAVAGREGASVQALAAADVVCSSIIDALDLLLDDSGLAATLRP